MRLLIVLILTIILSLSGSEFREKGDKAYKDKNYTEAIEYYKKELKNSGDDRSIYYNLSCTYALNGDLENSRETLYKSIDLGFLNKHSISTDEDLESLRCDKDSWNKIISHLDKKISEYRSSEGFKDYSIYQPQPTSLKSIDLRGEMSSVKHQGRRNTCSVFAATALMEYIIKKEDGKDLNLSENYNYWVGKDRCLYNQYLKDSYTSIDALAGILAFKAYNYGSMLEIEWPYENQNWLTLKDPRCTYVDGAPQKECFTGVPPEESTLLPYRSETILIERKDLKNYLLVEQKPIIFNVDWFFDAVDKESGRFRMPTEEELERRGGHVILLVGYDDLKKEYIFRNSWGPKWGDNGYGYFPEEYIDSYPELHTYLPRLDEMDLGFAEFMKFASMGISGKLAE
jgi:C1A family cysteine protease